MICLKICTFVVSITTFKRREHVRNCCDLLENLYLCGIYNNTTSLLANCLSVVICLKICTFVVSITTLRTDNYTNRSCDLLENLYLCGIYNNIRQLVDITKQVVICLKICTFVVSITTLIFLLQVSEPL